MHTVAIVVWDDVEVFELAPACEVFGVDRPELVSPWYRMVLCAARPGPVPISPGLSVPAPHGLDAAVGADTVIVPAGANVPPGVPEPLLRALREAHARGARIASICTGAFVLAEAGLLDGRRATTHWMHAAELARRYPRVLVDPSVLYADEGDILTSAGSAAGIDLCLHLVRKDHGTRVANALARRIVVPPHRDGGQAQYVDQPVTCGDEPGLGAVLDWARARLGRPIEVADLARQAGVSPRTFTRHLHAATGTSPLQWLLHERIRMAQQLLESTSEPVEEIARKCGFGVASGMRRHFARVAGVSPQAYRKTFHNGSADAESIDAGSSHRGMRRPG
ncbi:MAG TPA: helix-turn-helix domain-containing protein [Streptosporangiaceae bacterium]|nr:helix-turn-helix domain-containing protein [Streptosporangiaceae bacterium]